MTAALLEPADRRKLVGLLGQLGHDNDNVALNAGRKAHELLTRMGVSWGEMLAPPALPPPRTDLSNPIDRAAFASIPDPTARPGDAARYMLSSTVAWSAWEEGFLRSMAERRGATLSDRQCDVLLRLWARYGNEVGASAGRGA